MQLNQLNELLICGCRYTQPEAIVYFVAIIDVLQQYDASKQIERFAKVRTHAHVCYHYPLFKVNVLSLMPKFNFKEHAAGNQADCPWCEHSNMVDPETLQHIVTTFQFQVSKCSLLSLDVRQRLPIMLQCFPVVLEVLP